MDLLIKNYNVIIKDLSPSPHFTIGDLAAWGIVKWFKSGVIDHVPTNIADSYSELILTHNRVSELKSVREWLSRK